VSDTPQELIPYTVPNVYIHDNKMLQRSSRSIFRTAYKASATYIPSRNIIIIPHIPQQKEIKDPYYAVRDDILNGKMEEEHRIVELSEKDILRLRELHNNINTDIERWSPSFFWSMAGAICTTLSGLMASTHVISGYTTAMKILKTDYTKKYTYIDTYVNSISNDLTDILLTVFAGGLSGGLCTICLILTIDAHMKYKNPEMYMVKYHKEYNERLSLALEIIRDRNADTNQEALERR